RPTLPSPVLVIRTAQRRPNDQNRNNRRGQALFARSAMDFRLYFDAVCCVTTMASWSSAGDESSTTRLDGSADVSAVFTSVGLAIARILPWCTSGALSF